MPQQDKRIKAADREREKKQQKNTRKNQVRIIISHCERAPSSVARSRPSRPGDHTRKEIARAFLLDSREEENAQPGPTFSDRKVVPEPHDFLGGAAILAKRRSFTNRKFHSALDNGVRELRRRGRF